MGFLEKRRDRQQADQRSFNQKMASRPGLPVEAYVGMVENMPETRPIVAANPSAPVPVLRFLAGLNDPDIARALGGNPTWVSSTQLPPPTPDRNS